MEVYVEEVGKGEVRGNERGRSRRHGWELDEVWLNEGSGR